MSDFANKTQSVTEDEFKQHPAYELFIEQLAQLGIDINQWHYERSTSGILEVHCKQQYLDVRFTNIARKAFRLLVVFVLDTNNTWQADQFEIYDNSRLY